MKYIKRTQTDIKGDYIASLLKDRGFIKENEGYNDLYFNPTKENLLNPLDLEQIEELYQVFISGIQKGKEFHICVDPDVDGATSSSILYLYMEKYLRPLYPNFKISYHVPDGKAHGLDTLIDYFTEVKRGDIILVPDAGSNDFESHKILSDLGYQILCLDHHLCPERSDNAIVVNNQMSPRYENKALSGVGVVYKFLQYCDSQLNLNGADEFLDLVAMGEIGDAMDMNTLENRYICKAGLSRIKNPYFKALLKLQAYSIFGIKPEEFTDEFLLKNPPNQTQIAFYIVPLINAMIRVGSNHEKEKMFLAFVDGNKEVESTKRGHKEGEKEMLATQSARECSNMRNKQNREKERALDLLDIQIMENCLDENKILILNADELEVDNTLTGLCAMGVANKYKKPVLLGRTNENGDFKGSIRNIAGTELKDLRQFLLDSSLMNYVQG